MLEVANNPSFEVLNSIDAFSSYVNEVETIAQSLTNENNLSLCERASLILDGEASTTLRKTVPLEIRRDAGIFFTNHKLADRIALKIKELIVRGESRIIDPTCGVGNLLIACAKFLPLGDDLESTLLIWDKLLMGVDIYAPFVRLAKLRLLLLATLLTKNSPKKFENLKISNILDGINQSNFLNTPLKFNASDIFLLNPPYGYMEAPKDCSWGKGRIQTAALFFDRVFEQSYDGQHIFAILPDVLRSGSRYNKWRDNISKSSEKLEIELIGRFDKFTDVDVFLLHIVKNKNSVTSWLSSSEDDKKSSHHISDYFDVKIGPVVPHRHENLGPWVPYLSCQDAAPWASITELNSIRFRGTLYEPPFVVIRRTSSPAEKQRIIGTIVQGVKPIAVENHLIVIKPKDGTINMCKDLLKRLPLESTNKWINERIRCRHLTVQAIKELPW